MFAVHVLLYGCAGPGHLSVPDIHRLENRSSDYPVGIVPANFLPNAGLDFIVHGKGGGAAGGAAAGVAYCTELLYAAEPGAIAFLLCAPFGAVVGAIHGAVTSPSAKDVETTEDRIAQQILPLADQAMLAQHVRDYLLAQQDNPGISIAKELQGTATGSREESALETANLGRYRSILEVATLDIVFEGSGRKNKPACFVMKGRATKWDGYSGEKLDTMEPVYHGPCATVDVWIKDGGKLIIEEIQSGYQVVAEAIVDELYLVFIQGLDESRLAEDSTRMVPSFVLKPLHPALSKHKPDLGKVFSKRREKDVIASGGWYFDEVSDLSPTFSWEAFPRPFDLFAAESFEPKDISYELRIYGPAERWLWSPSALKLVHAASNLQKNHYRFPLELNPCSRYFWTVRAHFKLGGVARVTEWGGFYGSHFIIPSSPSNIRRNIYSFWTEDTRLFSYYYPFRTPASATNPGCWEQKAD